MYVGKAVNPKNRWKAHKSVSRKGKEKYPTKYFAVHAALAKYGIDNFEFVVGEHYSTNESVCEAEKYWISYLKEFGISLYNLTLGGDGMSPGAIFTERHRKNISLSKMGWDPSPETRLRMGAAKKFVFSGEKNNKAKITESVVREIRCLYASGNYTHRALAKLFNLTHATVGKIIRRELWPHVT